MLQTGRVDWPQVIMDLRREGMSARIIASKLRVNRTTVLSWRDNGAEPKGWITATNLLKLWERKTGNDWSRPPLV